MMTETGRSDATPHRPSAKVPAAAIAMIALGAALLMFGPAVFYRLMDDTPIRWISVVCGILLVLAGGAGCIQVAREEETRR